MSSHREAPEISKDPVCDSTDVYALSVRTGPTPSRSSPTTSRCRARLVDPTSMSSARTSCTRSTSTTTATPRLTSRTSSASTPRCATRGRFLYNTGPINTLDDPDWNRVADVLGHQGRRRAKPSLSRRRAVPAVQHRAALDARTTTGCRDAAVQTLRGGGRCSPASATRCSTSTWARSSTWAPCARCRTCT